jgi:hypothetical protein
VRLGFLAAATTALALAATTTARPAAAGCAPRAVSSAYAASVDDAVAAGRDVWGGDLLRDAGGPTYERARRYLAPLTQALQWGRRPLTASGSYYVPLSYPFTSYGSPMYALHVADGSEIITRRVGGPSLQIFVGGAGKERYGSCLARLRPARLAQGHLPILQTAYEDGGGVRYVQESFVGRAYGAFGARSVISFVKLVVDARRASRGATVRLVPWRRLAHSAPDRLALKGQTRLIVSDGAQFVDGVARYRVPPGEKETVYAEWLNAPSDARYVHADSQTYEVARATVVKFWESRLDAGATFSVPEPAVQDAELGVLTQLVSFGWRYSIGNPYEELSYAESLDAAEVAVEYGYPSVAKSIIELALRRIRADPAAFRAFRGGHILSTAAMYVRATRDRAFLQAETPALADVVARIAARQLHTGKLRGQLIPEPLSTDLENHAIASVPGQLEAIQGLRAIARVWLTAEDDVHGDRAAALAASIDAAVRPALAHVSKHLRDGTLFVPDRLTGQKAFGRLTASRDGSYWNLMMPYAFSSGWFAPHTSASRGILRYLMRHGSRLLGVTRTYAGTVYGARGGAGLAPVYGLGTARFFADNDQPDQLDLTLYGTLANGMTQATYVSGEAVSLLPVDRTYDRAMFMPPNAGANASYLGTLRELLVHERRGPLGAPVGLDLAFSTPRAWLGDGKTIDVSNAPTSFGKVSYSITRHGSSVVARLVLPRTQDVRLRLRLPAGEQLSRVLVGSSSVASSAGGTIDLGARHGSLLVRATLG